MHKFTDTILLYFQFFTGIPIHYQIKEPVKVFREGIHFFPVFAILYAGIHALVYGLLRLRLSPSAAWVFIMVFDMILTRGFHYDALADTADGLFSSRPRQQILTIMRDPLIGTMGALALIAYCLGVLVFGIEKIASLPNLIAEIYYLMTIKILSRGGLAAMFFRFVYAEPKPDGIGDIGANIEVSKLAIAQFIFAGWALMHGLPTLIIYGLTLGCLALYRSWVIKQLGGLNGDTTGAATLIAEWLLLLFSLMID